MRKHFANGGGMVAETMAHAAEERLAFAAVQPGEPTAAPSRSRVAALPAGGAARAMPRIRNTRQGLLAALSAEWERGTGFLLVPVLFGAGAATNFALAHEPSLPLLATTALVLAAGLVAAGRWMAVQFVTAAALILCLGMLAASFETWRTGTKMLGAEISTRITGRVVSVEARAGKRSRITIDVAATERPKLRHAPDRIRVTVRELPAGLAAGQQVTGVVRLLPPTGPVRPDSYDFSFESYFDGIGASGFFLAGPFPGELEPASGLADRLAARLENARHALAAHIRARIDGTEGEIAAALVAGVRSGIPEAENEVLRRTGLAHFISISGLHMALVAGTVLGGLRAAFALFPAFSSRFPVKKGAALAALAALCLYLLVSGAAVAAQRSFVMFAVMLVAVFFDRAALTMRNLAIAALVVLAVAPHEIMGPSFQMSFAATAALIGAYAWHAERRRAKAADEGWRHASLPWRAAQLALLFFAGLAMTSIIAGAATGLFGAWHFQRVSPLGLVANLAAMPLVSVVVMPAAVVGTLLIPLGLDAPFLALMGKALAVVMAIARWLAERSPADGVGLVPPAAVAVLSVALAILTVATTRLRLAAVPLVIAGGALIATREMPDVLVSEDGRLVAMRMSDGRLAVNRARPSAFTVENWAKAVQAGGVARPLEAIPAGAAEHAFSCSDGLCTARHASGAEVAFAASAEAARAACRRAALIVIDDATAGDPCSPNAGAAVITKRDLARKGSAAVRLGPPGAMPDIAFAIGEGERPWHRQRRFSREARGLPPYQRKKQADPQAQPDSTADAGQ